MDDTAQHVADKLKKDLEDVKSRLEDAEAFLAEHSLEEDPKVQKLEEAQEHKPPHTSNENNPEK